MRAVIAGCTLALCLAGADVARAWHVEGHIYCDFNRNGRVDAEDLPLSGVRVRVYSTTISFEDTDVSDGTGAYHIELPDTPESYVVEADPATVPPDAAFLIPSPAPYPFTLTDEFDRLDDFDWLVQSESCQVGACWFTGGGAKFSQITRTPVAEKGPQHNFGGNVNAGCDPDPGEGGQWNHVSHAGKLHLLGKAIEVVRCGNVPGIPPGSESPASPFNFIEYRGTGTLKGIHGNKADHPLVYFFARGEDRNEPGSSGAKDGALVDRYFIHVYANPADPAGSTLMLVDLDGNSATVDPVTITDGNFQIHVNACGNGGR